MPKTTQGDITNAFQQGWRQALADDHADIDLDTVTNYAEGKLLGPEKVAFEALAMSTPKIIELLEAIDCPLPRDVTTTASFAASGNVLSAREVGRLRQRKPGLGWAVAAALAFVVGLLSLRTNNVTRERDLALRNATSAADLALEAEKERLSQLVARHGPVHLAGRVTDQLLRSALDDTGNARGELQTPEELAAIDASQQRIRDIRKLGISSNPQTDIEVISALVNSGNLRDAEQEIQQLERQKDDRVAESQILNLRGILLAAKAQLATESEMAALQKDAAAMFNRAGDEGLAIAWLNLAQLLVQRDDREGARQALRNYMKSEKDPALRAIVERAFPNLGGP